MSRNLAEYPVTETEIMELLAELAETILKEGGIGDMRPLLLNEAAKSVWRDPTPKNELGLTPEL